MRSYLFFNVQIISDSVCNDLNSENTESWKIPTMTWKELMEPLQVCRAELAISCGSSLLVGDLSNKDVELSWMQQATARSGITCPDIGAEMKFCHCIRYCSDSILVFSGRQNAPILFEVTKDLRAAA